MISPLGDAFPALHPAFVHVPLGLLVPLVLAMFLSFGRRASSRWITTSLFLASVALAGSLVALTSGLLWGRKLGLIPQAHFFPKVEGPTALLAALLQHHALAAITGAGVGVLCVLFLWRKVRTCAERGEPDRSSSQLQSLSSRGVGSPALFLGLLWAAAWGYCGKMGGAMVYGNADTVAAAATAEAAKRADSEIELPIRALDYASLEPVEAAPTWSKVHGHRWVRTWVTASGIDAYRAGRPLPAGAYVVLSTFEDEKGRPGSNPGPLFFEEVLADGRPAFAFYWPRVPESRRTEFDGEDAIYWRSPHPKLDACSTCHAKPH